MDIHDRQPRSFGDIGVSATLYTAEQVDGIVADAAEEAVSAIPAEVERAVGAMATCPASRIRAPSGSGSTRCGRWPWPWDRDRNDPSGG